MNKAPFSDEELTASAKSALATMMDAIPQPEECSHEFSDAFDEKMQAVFRQERRRRTARKTVKRLAMLLVLCCVTAGVYLGVNANARAAFFGWVREHYQNYVVYCYSGSWNPAAEPTLPAFLPQWLPDGYAETSEADEQATGDGYDCTLIYRKADSDQILSFRCSYGPADTDMSVYGKEAHYEEETVSVNGCHGNYYRSTAEDESSMLVWFDGDNDVTFLIDGVLDQRDLLKMAESVEKVR